MCVCVCVCVCELLKAPRTNAAFPLTHTTYPAKLLRSTLLIYELHMLLHLYQDIYEVNLHTVYLKMQFCVLLYTFCILLRFNC